MYLKYIQLLFLVLTLIACGRQQPPDNTEDPFSNDAQQIDAADPYTYLNQLRQLSGLVALTKNEKLSAAALNHAKYLVKNNQSGHGETPGLPHFSGETPSQRVISAGYPSNFIGEGIAHRATQNQSIDDLMSAIYHRFTLFNIEFDEIGMGFDLLNDSQAAFVHNMGNSHIANLCSQAESFVSGSYFSQICVPDIRISQNDYSTAIEVTATQNPNVVIWPPKDGVDIPPAFFEESPDPLPDYSVSGYPVSVQFNHWKVTNISLQSFRLFDLEKSQYLTTRQMAADTDPNQSFKQLEFAIFPLQRLEWAQNYRVEFEYLEDGLLVNTEWTFRTKTLDGVIKRITGNHAQVSIKNNEKTFLYFVPNSPNDVLSSYDYIFPADTLVHTTIIDSNTLGLLINGKVGDKGTLNLSNNTSIEIVLGE